MWEAAVVYHDNKQTTNNAYYSQSYVRQGTLPIVHADTYVSLPV